MNLEPYIKFGDIQLSANMISTNLLSSALYELSSKIDTIVKPLSGLSFDNGQTIEYVISSIIANLGGTYIKRES